VTRPTFPTVPSAFDAHWQPRPDNSGMLNLKSCEMQHPDADRLLAELLAQLPPQAAWQYPRQRPLIARLAEADGVSEDQVLLAAGSDSAIGMIVDALAVPAGRLVLQEPSFDSWLYYAALRGVPATRCAGLRGFPPAVTTVPLLAALRDGPAAVASLTNPGNPAGLVLPAAEVAELARAARDRGHLLVVDECYAAYCGLTHVPLLAAHPNLIVIRSLSKSCALAGARISAVFGSPELIGYLRRFKTDATVSAPAVALALAALSRSAELRAIRSDVIAIRDDFTGRVLAEHPGWAALPSGANFVTFCTGVPGEGDRIAGFLAARGIRIRSLDGIGGLDGGLRFSMASRERMMSVADELRAAGEARRDAVSGARG
jgi:histidinol-phosphate aminotransferase